LQKLEKGKVKLTTSIDKEDISYIFKKIEIFLYELLKLPGLLFFIFIFPLISLMVTEVISINIFLQIGLNLPNEIFTGILLGIIIFASTSLFPVELRVLDLPKFGKFSKLKFFISIIVSSLIVSYFMKILNLNLDYNSFLTLTELLSIDITNVIFESNNFLVQYFLILVKILPIALATVYFIKLFIFTFISNILYFLISGTLMLPPV
jgi:hypothetical protein